MKNFFTFFLLLTTLSVAGQERDRMKWFSEAKLGIFIHWGIYSVNGVQESWAFDDNYLPYDEYMGQGSGFGFTAEKYNPTELVKLIKESGAKYTVITSKHHDGVALWDTKANNLSVKKSTPAATDLRTPFVKTVRAEKRLKLGLYYSLLDWSHPDYPNKTKTEKRYTDDTVRWENFRNFMFTQLGELSKNYNPDLFWFDGDWEQSAERWNSEVIIHLLRKKNPNVIINSRIRGYGDYGTPEQGVPVSHPKDRYWELCTTMNTSWGYQGTDTFYKSANHLKEFGCWTSKHKEAIYETRAGIDPKFFKNGYTTLNPSGDIYSTFTSPINRLALWR